MLAPFSYFFFRSVASLSRWVPVMRAPFFRSATTNGPPPVARTPGRLADAPVGNDVHATVRDQEIRLRERCGQWIDDSGDHWPPVRYADRSNGSPRTDHAVG